MAMIAYKCPDIQVVVVDINAARIAAWNSDVSFCHFCFQFIVCSSEKLCWAFPSKWQLGILRCYACMTECQKARVGMQKPFLPLLY